MAGEIGLRRLFIVGNKIVDERDEEFLRSAFPETGFLEMIPYVQEMRRGERENEPVLERLNPGLMARFEKILDTLEESIEGRGIKR
jgi:CO dehydrogenase nickel-insertion accessory protein CooC1